MKMRFTAICTIMKMKGRYEMTQEEHLKLGEFFKRKPRLITQENGMIVLTKKEDEGVKEDGETTSKRDTSTTDN